jgi:hypothetical protein
MILWVVFSFIILFSYISINAVKTYLKHLNSELSFSPQYFKHSVGLYVHIMHVTLDIYTALELPKHTKKDLVTKFYIIIRTKRLIIYMMKTI